MGWNLYLDDLRTPPADRDWVICRSTNEALAAISDLGLPGFISFDHDLGDEDTSMVFLRRLVNELWDGGTPPPVYQVHSANPVGVENIISFMESWKRSMNL